MIRLSLKFALQLSVILLLTGCLHFAYLYANGATSVLSTLIFCYLLNFVMAMAIYISLVKLAADENKYLGFIFMLGSVLKFAAYFLIFDPLFKQDGQLSKVEFFLFFVPYLASLTAETFALARLLRSQP